MAKKVFWCDHVDTTTSRSNTTKTGLEKMFAHDDIILLTLSGIWSVASVVLGHIQSLSVKKKG